MSYCAFYPESLLEISQLPERFFNEGFLDIRLAAAGTLNEKSDKEGQCQSLGSHGFGNISYTSNQLSPGNNDIVTATSAEERTIGRNAFSNDSLAEIQKTQNPFSDECKQAIINQTFSMNPELAEIRISTNQLPTLLSYRSGIVEHPRISDRAELVDKQHALLNSPEQPYTYRTFGTEKLANSRNIPDQIIYQEGNLLSPSTNTINRNLYGTESVTDIASIPEQFYSKSFESFRNMRSDWRNRETSLRNNLQVVNRYAFGKQSLTDINDIGNQFPMKHHDKNYPSEVPRNALYRTLTDMKAISDPFAPKGILYK
ncbi:unnamed protein product [Onchocerca flexuosa]|uniref:Uncharacterized protein n=1 Tax=Onchocerca flexuosa TaxID=387005 RepID=A0A183H2Y0_9BILA|nr:unnamed protein product [Onchocerca flexuosa]